MQHAMCWPCFGPTLPSGVLQWQGWQTLFLVVRPFLCIAGACSCSGTSPQKHEHPSGTSSEGCNLLFNRTSWPLSPSVAWTTEHGRDWSRYGREQSEDLRFCGVGRRYHSAWSLSSRMKRRIGPLSMNGTKNNAKELDQRMQIELASVMLLESLRGPCIAEDGSMLQ